MSGNLASAVFACVCIFAALAGCASPHKDPPTHIAVALPATNKVLPLVRVEDVRSDSSKRHRLSGGVNPTTFLSDSVFAPSPVEIVGGYLSRGMPAQRRSVKIELTRFDVGFMGASCPSETTSGNVLGVPAGAAGAVAGLMTCALMKRGSTAYADVTIRVDGKEYLGVDEVQHLGVAPIDALLKALENAMYYLVQEIIRTS